MIEIVNIKGGWFSVKQSDLMYAVLEKYDNKVVNYAMDNNISFEKAKNILNEK